MKLHIESHLKLSEVLPAASHSLKHGLPLGEEAADNGQHVPLLDRVSNQKSPIVVGNHHSLDKTAQVGCVSKEVVQQHDAVVLRGNLFLSRLYRLS